MNPRTSTAAIPSIGAKTGKDYSACRPNYPDRFFDVVAAVGVGLTGATLAPEQIEAFDREHEQLLKNIAPDSFTISHRIDAHLFQLRS